MSQTSEATPLLNDGPRSVSANDADVPDPKSRPSRIRELTLFVWALLATAGVVFLAVWTQHTAQTSSPAKASKRNLIFMVSDGMGPASLSLTRSYRQYVENVPIDDILTLDKHFWGTSRTRSSNSLVTDSAAGATAFACGKKSYNGAISILPGDYEPCGTVLEAAKRAGYMTGLVVTTDITDATPATFASHVVIRALNDDVAVQEIGEGVLGRVVDLMLGGGRCHFLPNSTEGSCRMDDIDVAGIAQKDHGWTYANNRKGFDALKGGEEVNFPMMGLFASNDIPFEIDRRNMNDVYPSLSEMTKTALRALEKATENSDKGFFLMIEGSRIDHAGHINDPAAQVHEVLEYDKAFKAVIDFLEKSSTDGVMVATSDHETGGLSTALQEPGHFPVYNWYPRALANSNASAERLSHLLREYIANNDVSDKQTLKNWINTHLVIQGLGITDGRSSELDALVEDPDGATELFAAMISLRAHIGWSTHGHSAVDVNIYSSGGPGTEKIRGNVENTDIGKFLRGYLDVDVDSITKELREKMDKKTLMKGYNDVKEMEMPAIAKGSALGDAGYDHWMANQQVGIEV